MKLRHGAAAILLTFLCLIPPLHGQEDSGVRGPGPFVLTIGEAVPPAARHDPHSAPVPWLSFRTERDYSCLLPLASEVSVHGDEIELRISGLAPVEICPQAIGPARGSEYLPAIPGQYSLHIVAEGRREEYAIEISDTLLVLSPEAGAFTRLVYRSFQRAPRYSAAFYCNLPWGDGAPDPTYKPVCDRFQEILRDSLDAQPFDFDPDLGEIAFPLKGSVPRADMRYYQFPGPEVFPEVCEIINNLTMQYIPEVYHYILGMTTWRGTRLSVYTCRPDKA